LPESALRFNAVRPTCCWSGDNAATGLWPSISVRIATNSS
jgi:hypothetical protein